MRCWNWIGRTLHGERPKGYMVGLGWRTEGKRAVRRPKKTWRRTVEVERQAEWNDWNTLREVANDRVEWKQNVAALCAYWHE